MSPLLPPSFNLAAPHPWKLAWLAAQWLVTLLWTARTLPAIPGLRRVPDLLKLPLDCSPAGMPTLTVIVPAKDEATAIAATLHSLIAQDYPNLHIVAVDDRSTDTTGAQMDAIAAQHPGRLRVLHIHTLPPGWAGKVHAMTLAADTANTDFLLFTDGDITFAPDALRRALTTAVATRADHFICLPTLRIHSWDEGTFLAVFQLLGSLAVRLWKLPDPKAKRDAAGVGAFNLVRRSAFDSIGGYAALPLEVVEDLRLGQRMKAAGFRSVAAFGTGLVQLHWAPGALGIVRTVTKNFFAVLGFRLPLVFLAALSTVGIFWLPLLGLLLPSTRIPALLSVVAIAVSCHLNGPRSGVSVWYGLLCPLGSLGVAAALLWSALTTLRQGGIRWRGTFYSLADLRRTARTL